MLYVRLNGEDLDVAEADVSIGSWPRVDFLRRTAQPGQAAISFELRSWATDYRMQPVEIRRSQDNATIFKGVVVDQIDEMGPTGSRVSLQADTAGGRVRAAWPADRLEHTGRFPLDVTGVVPRVFGLVQSVSLTEVAIGRRLIARNTIYGAPDAEGMIDVYEDDTLVATAPVFTATDGLGDSYSAVELDEGLDGKTLRSGPVIGLVPRSKNLITTVEQIAHYVSGLVGGGYSLAARTIPRDVASLPVGMVLNDEFSDVTFDILDRLGQQYGFIVDLQGGWTFGPDLNGHAIHISGTLRRRHRLLDGLIGNCRVEWGWRDGAYVGSQSLPSDIPAVRALAHMGLPTSEIMGVDIPSADVAAFVAGRHMALNGRLRERWTIEVPLGASIDPGARVELDGVDRAEGDDLTGWVESVTRGEVFDVIEVLV